MAQLLFNNLFSGSKPQDGQLTINLNLTIKVESDGSLKVMAGEEPVINKPKPSRVEEKIKYEIPDFDYGGEKLIDFGKNA